MTRSVMLVEFSPSGGLFQFTFQLGSALAARGNQVQLITGPRPELQSRVPGLRVRPLLPTWHPAAGAEDNVVLRKARRVLRAVRYHLAWLRLALLLRSERPDVVQWSTWRFPVDGWMVHRLARRPGAPVMVALVHAPRPFNEQRRGGGLFKRSRMLHRCLDLGYSTVDATLVLGERSAEDLLANHPGARRVEIVPHGDESVFSDGEPAEVSTTAPVALFFGTLSANKGLEELLEAFSDVHAEMPAARLVIAGSPSGEVDVAELRRRAGPESGVEWQVGYVPVPEVAALFQSARLVVTPYRYANVSGVVHLAHTFARPVVATAVGDLPATVMDGVSGLLVPQGDRAALGEALRQLLTDPARAAELGRAGRARLAERSWPVVAERVEALYESCAGARRDGTRRDRTRRP